MRTFVSLPISKETRHRLWDFWFDYVLLPIEYAVATLRHLKWAFECYVLIEIEFAGKRLLDFAYNLVRDMIPSLFRRRNASRCQCFSSGPHFYDREIDPNQHKHAIPLDIVQSRAAIATRASFLDLPRELRDIIYQQCVPTRQFISLGCVLCLPHRPARWLTSKFRNQTFPAALMVTCKQVHREVATTFYSDNSFEFKLEIDGSFFPEKGQMLDLHRIERLPWVPLHPAYCGLVRYMRIDTMSLCPVHAARLVATMALRLHNVEGAYIHRFDSRTFCAGWHMGPRSGCYDPGETVYFAAQSSDLCSFFRSQFQEWSSVDSAVLLALSKTQSSIGISMRIPRNKNLPRDITVRFDGANAERFCADYSYGYEKTPGLLQNLRAMLRVRTKRSPK